MIDQATEILDGEQLGERSVDGLIGIYVDHVHGHPARQPTPTACLVAIAVQVPVV